MQDRRYRVLVVSLVACMLVALVGGSYFLVLKPRAEAAEAQRMKEALKEGQRQAIRHYLREQSARISAKIVQAEADAQLAKDDKAQAAFLETAQELKALRDRVEMQQP